MGRATLSRREALRLGGLGIVGAAGAGLVQPATAVAKVAAGVKARGYVPRPNPTQYRLAVARRALNPDGKKAVSAVVANGTLPAPEIRVQEGEQLRIQVENHLTDEPTSMHWHGVLVPSVMDGVPHISTAPIDPARVFIAEFPILQSGTYWYHSHYEFQEQLGLAGAFIIEPRHERGDYDRDYVVLLSDWLDANPEQVFADLRRGGAMKDMGGTKMAPMGDKPTAAAADLSDVKYAAFLLNGRGNQDPWSGVAKRGERVRLRIINGAASTYFRFMVDGHPLQITHADGPAVLPVQVDNLLIGMGECYDAIVTVKSSGSFTIRGMAQDGSGQAIGILHTADVTPKADLSMPKFGPRELAYSDLVAPEPTTLPDGPVKEFALDATGNMMKYVWSINDQVYPDAEPLLIQQGDRVRVNMTNKTSMWHPFHLHGHFFRLLTGSEDVLRYPLKHTANLAPNGSLRFEFTADNPGKWFFHCHNVYHLEAGMARVFVYTSTAN